MKEITIKTIDRSRPFETKELFFSTTDHKGILTSWNEVFTRVAAYEPSEVNRQPHNLVRHPDMPRCVFKLLWDYLLSNRPIGAYVKNLAKTGEFYWVFALASPCDDGFLSIRLKPTSPLIATIESLYAELLACEKSFDKDWREGMTAATTLLQTKLTALGFSDYSDFMTHALRMEYLARRNHLRSTEAGGVSDGRLAPMVEGCSALVELRKKIESLETFLDKFVSHLNSIALNSGIRAVRLGDAGKALAVIGEEVGRLSRSIREQSREVKVRGDELSTVLRKVSFDVSLAALQLEMAESFVVEQKGTKISSEEQILRYGKQLSQMEEQLSQSASASTQRALSSVTELRGHLSHFGTFVDFLAKTLLTIQFSHVTGKTQAARVPGGEGFTILLEELISLTDAAREELNSLRISVSTSEETVIHWHALRPRGTSASLLEKRQ